MAWHEMGGKPVPGVENIGLAPDLHAKQGSERCDMKGCSLQLPSAGLSRRTEANILVRRSHKKLQ